MEKPTEQTEEKKNEKSIEEEKLEKRLFIFPRKRLLILLFIGILVGIVLKGNVLKNYVIGFEDYKLEELSSDYNFTLPEPEVAGEQDETSAPAQEQPSCN